ncbi:serine hydrolase [Spirosoma rhododendri]|uniref:Serine hydrolase n=1 Tax=Spirosoma rhododendri TaxID=2728024 RepID=A0A7L5DXH5_9BACT|nr:serine hydrolase [Spirosoma rhododendri]QJD80230.1 serine hydrolase [Spirosoma rhododendri]
MKTVSLVTLLGCLCVWISTATAQVNPLTSAQIDTLAQRALTTFNVPGMAIAVIKDGNVVHRKGYGVRSLNTQQPVDENTLFGIASNSKAFTAAALAILIDEGKLTWDDKVTKHIPEFRMYNAYVTDAFTIRDLLTHRSGLGLGAGDLMFFPDSSSFTITDVLRSFQYMKPVSGFRTKYDYDNLLYMVAGEVIERVSGKSWAAFVEERLMKPLQMTHSAGSFERLPDKSNVIDVHAPVDGTVRVISRFSMKVGDAAGGINASVADMSQWVLAQLDGGRYGNGQRLFSAQNQAEMWKPQTIIDVSPTPIPPYNTHFAAYGLGWFLSDVKGYKQVSHTGGLPGNVTQVMLIPELRLGILVFTNQQSGAAFSSVTNTIKDAYLGLPPTDWIGRLRNRERKGQAEADSVTRSVWTAIASAQKANMTTIDFAPYVGTYRDRWFGDVVLSQQHNRWWFRAVRSPKLVGEVLPYKDNTFIVKWNDRSFDADAYMTVKLDGKRNPVAISMKPISPLTDFSFDFQDLDLQRVVK